MSIDYRSTLLCSSTFYWYIEILETTADADIDNTADNPIDTVVDIYSKDETDENASNGDYYVI